MTKDWNPDKACEEMAALFAEADRIMSKPIYQDKTSAGDVHTVSTSSPPTLSYKPIAGDINYGSNLGNT